MVEASAKDICTTVTSDNPKSICKTGIIVAKENSDNMVDKTLKNKFNATCPRYGGMNLRRSDMIFMFL
jgi:hypothetical protein